MKISEIKKRFNESIIEEYGNFYGRGLLIKWKIQSWWNDLWIVGFLRDVTWWIFDGKAYWDDAGDCGRKLCRYCGKKPF